MDISKVFDPKYVFTIYFPIVFALKWVLGVQLLGTMIVVEWLNQVLKWYLNFKNPILSSGWISSFGLYKAHAR